MGIRRISHIVLYVSDVKRSADWYNELLGFIPKAEHNVDGRKAIFTQADASDNDDDHDLAFFQTGGGAQNSGPWKSRFEEQDPNAPKAGLYHVSYQVETLEELEKIKLELQRQGRIGNIESQGDFQRVYGHDPDGLLFEVSWVPSLKQQVRKLLKEQKEQKEQAAKPA